MPELRRVFWRPVAVIALAELGLLATTSSGYGFHRDELYFLEAGRHPALGYPDQPPLTPLLARVSAELFGASPAGLRVFSELAITSCVVLGGLLARELGGGRAAQTIAAASVAVSAAMFAGHLLSTETFDLLFWVALLWLLVRLLRTRDERLWLPMGAVAGLALENKDLVLMLAAAVAVSVVIVRRFDLFRSRWLLAGAAAALALWLPNLIWQALHDWPQVTMSRRITAANGTTDRIELVPFQLVLISPLLVPVWIAGLVWLLRAPETRRWRVVAWAYPVLLVLTLATGGKPYYPAALLILLVAAGAVVLERRLRTRLRTALLVAALALSAAVSALLSLPLVPAGDLHATPIPSLNKDAIETIGWPQFVRRVAAVYDGLPSADRPAIVLTENYGEAGAVDRYGGALGLPQAYSGHNGFGEWGPPPDRDEPVVAVGFDRRSYLLRFFERVRLAARFYNGYQLDNQEQGARLWICRGLRKPWAQLWPRLRHLS